MADCGKHFKCVGTNQFVGLSSTLVLAMLSGTALLMDILVFVIEGAAVPGLGVVAGVAFIAAVFELCAFLHGGKLICIQDSSCTIGRLMELIPVGHGKSGFEKMDDDFTMNILPAPHSSLEVLAEMTASDPHQSPFLVEQPASANHGLGFAGISVQFDDIAHDTEVFHVEVKGCRVHDVCLVMKAFSFGAPVVGGICSIPLIGWAVCAIAAAIWLALTAAAMAIAWAGAHVGDINDVYDPAAGTLTAADEKTGEGGDVILVRGDWIYDAGHSGWNEIQPITHVQKLTDVVDPRFRSMAKADAALVDDFKREVLDPWCFRVEQGKDPGVKVAQGEPENQWHIHPLIDGCTREPVLV